MTAHEERRTIPGLSRRNVLRTGLLAGVGLATAGATSAAFTGTAKAASLQTTWAWCMYCQGMWYAGYFYSQPSQLNGNGNLGYCPYNGSAGHWLSNDDSFDYQLGYNFGTGGSDPQGGWLWCGACMGLYTSLHTPSVCPAGGTHLNGGGRFDPNGTSADYYLYNNQPVTSNPQAYWRWCGLCQGLYFQGNNSGKTNGVCPFYGQDGGHHQMGTGSFNYEIAYNGSLGVPVLE